MQHDKPNRCAWTTPQESQALGEPPEPKRFDLSDPTLSTWLDCRIVRLQDIIDNFDIVGGLDLYPVYEDTIRLRGLLSGMRQQFDDFRQLDQELTAMESEGSANIAEEAADYLIDPKE
jgi:hypothetical protein